MALAQTGAALADVLYAHKRNKAQPHVFDLLCHPARRTDEGRRAIIKQWAQALLVKDLDDPKRVAYFLPSSFWGVNSILDNGRFDGDDWISRLRLAGEYLGRPYDHYKSIPCIKNLAIQVRTIERAAPAGTFPHDIWRSKAKTSAMFEEMEFVGGSVIANQARKYVESAGEFVNSGREVQPGALFEVKGGNISFPAIHAKVWRASSSTAEAEEASEITTGHVVSVSLPALASLFEEHTAPVLQVGDAVRISVAGSEGGWLVLVTELFEPDSVRGSFLCIGRGTRLWTSADVITLPGCSQVNVDLADGEVLVSSWVVSFQASNIIEVISNVKGATFRDPKSVPSSKELHYQAYLDVRTLRVKKVVFAPSHSAGLYLLHERFMYTSRNGSWKRARDYMADRAFTELLQFLSAASSRAMPFDVTVTVDRDWFLLLPAAALAGAAFEGGIFSAQLITVADVEEVLGAMNEACQQQPQDPQQPSYVLQKQPGPKSNLGDSHFFHMYLPVAVHFNPLMGAGDTICVSFHAARVHNGHIMWSTVQRAAKRVRR